MASAEDEDSNPLCPSHKCHTPPHTTKLITKTEHTDIQDFPAQSHTDPSGVLPFPT